MCSLPFSLLSNLLVFYDSFKEIKTNIGDYKEFYLNLYKLFFDDCSLRVFLP